MQPGGKRLGLRIAIHMDAILVLAVVVLKQNQRMCTRIEIISEGFFLRKNPVQHYCRWTQ